MNNPQVAPHGILVFVAVALAVVLLIHLAGFRIVGALKVG